MPHRVGGVEAPEPQSLTALPAVRPFTKDGSRRIRRQRIEAWRQQMLQAGPIEVSVCIANWNCREFLRQCLESLLDATQGVSLEVIVVDNASVDGAPEMVEREFPEVVLVRNAENLGFARANNQASRKARGSYLFFLNNDTVIPKETLKQLVDFARAHPEAGIIGPRLCDALGRTQVSYRLEPTLAILLHRTTLLRWTGLLRGTYHRYRRSDFHTETTRPVEVLMGAAMLIPRPVFEQVGGWDEEFTFGGEDIDLSTRIRRSGQVIYHPEVKIVHYGRVSTRQHIGFASSHMNIGFLRFLRKNGSNETALNVYKLVVTLDLPVQIIAKSIQYGWRTLLGHGDKAAKTKLALRGLTHFLMHGLGAFWRT
jgi:N-acetylglucosaminyl-diphospho-decaprenol L-rhamnosyltransferase